MSTTDTTSLFNGSSQLVALPLDGGHLRVGLALRAQPGGHGCHGAVVIVLSLLGHSSCVFQHWHHIQRGQFLLWESGRALIGLFCAKYLAALALMQKIARDHVCGT